MERPCKSCIDRIGEAITNWLFEGMEGGIIGTSGHWSEEERRACPSFVFHWGIEDAEWDEDDPDEDEDPDELFE